jgi:hypothetical protein
MYVPIRWLQPDEREVHEFEVCQGMGACPDVEAKRSGAAGGG